MLYLLLGGVLVYSYYHKPTMASASIPDSLPIGPSPAQPSQKYPFSWEYAPRADHANQPWYGGNRISDGSSSGSVANVLDNTKSIRYSLEDLWKSLGLSTGVDTNAPKPNLMAAPMVFVSNDPAPLPAMGYPRDPLLDVGSINMGGGSFNSGGQFQM